MAVFGFRGFFNFSFEDAAAVGVFFTVVDLIFSLAIREENKINLRSRGLVSVGRENDALFVFICCYFLASSF